MRISLIAAAGIAALSLTACNNSAQDTAAENKADALESQAAATPNEAQETQLNQQADQVEQKAGESH
jgi:hypothetical protein